MILQVKVVMHQNLPFFFWCYPHTSFGFKVDTLSQVGKGLESWQNPEVFSRSVMLRTEAQDVVIDSFPFLVTCTSQVPVTPRSTKIINDGNYTVVQR